MEKFSLILVLFVAALQAAPVGNTAAPGLLQQGVFTSSKNSVSLRFGYEGDFVADGRLKQFDQGTGRIDCYQQDTNSGTATCNFFERLDIYGVFGSSKVETDWRFTDALDAIHRIELKTGYSFLWALGGRAIFYQGRHLFFGMGSRYSSSEYQPKTLTSDGVSEAVHGSYLHWKEWQINADMAYKINIFIPYIGLKYSNVRAYTGGFSVPIAANGSGSDSFQNRVPVGLYLGCALTSGSYMFFNLEGRLIDEEAITVSADLRF